MRQVSGSFLTVVTELGAGPQMPCAGLQAHIPHPGLGAFPHRQCWWWWRAHPGPGHHWCWWSAWPGPPPPAGLRSGWWCSQRGRSLAGGALSGELWLNAFCWSHCSDGEHGTQGCYTWWQRWLQLLLGGCPGQGPSGPHRKAYGCRPGRGQREKVSDQIWDNLNIKIIIQIDCTLSNKIEENDRI